MSKMQRFVEFWGGIWEQNEPMPNMPWMEEVKAELGERANLVSEFAITDENMKKEVTKRKNWTAPGIDGIQNLKFEPAQKALRKSLTDLYVDTTMIPEWWPSRRTALLPKTKNLSDEKNYRPITYLTTSDLDGPGAEIHKRTHCSEQNMGRRTTGSYRRRIGHSRSAHHRQVYHVGGQAVSF